LHESRRDRRKYLQQAIERCFLDGGTVLIPAFSIGRIQKLLYELEEIIHNIDKLRSSKNRIAAAVPEKSVWDHLDIIVDSPLASKFTSSYVSIKKRPQATEF
jgi:metallo-beta-lactamase family protein